MNINNAFYDTLGEMWYTGQAHPVALLRAENAFRIPWVSSVIGPLPCSVLDIGCGAGMLTNALALQGHKVSGIDLSASSLEIAKKADTTGSVTYIPGVAEALPFAAASFDVVSALDLLEHVTDPKRVIDEASRVLKPGGLFFFHTFNRNLLSYLLVIKGVEWYVKNTPERMHVYNLFIKPKELSGMCREAGLAVAEIRGSRPLFGNLSFWKGLLKREVPTDFRFAFTRSLATGYIGYARKI